MDPIFTLISLLHSGLQHSKLHHIRYVNQAIISHCADLVLHVTSHHKSRIKIEVEITLVIRILYLEKDRPGQNLPIKLRIMSVL